MKLSSHKITFWSILILILLTCYAKATAQNNVSIGIYQDARLAILGDDHGNDPFTLDFKIDVTLQGNQFNGYYFEMRPQFEYADLKGGKYVSWLVSGGWVFNELIVKNLEAGLLPTIGVIHREGGFITYGITGDLSYKIGRLKLSGLYQWIKRSDLGEGLRPNFYMGIKYNIL